jgi:hypothetical protein
LRLQFCDLIIFWRQKLAVCRREGDTRREEEAFGLGATRLAGGVPPTESWRQNPKGRPSARGSQIPRLSKLQPPGPIPLDTRRPAKLDFHPNPRTRLVHPKFTQPITTRISLLPSTPLRGPVSHGRTERCICKAWLACLRNAAGRLSPGTAINSVRSTLFQLRPSPSCLWFVPVRASLVVL